MLAVTAWLKAEGDAELVLLLEIRLELSSVFNRGCGQGKRCGWKLLPAISDRSALGDCLKIGYV